MLSRRTFLSLTGAAAVRVEPHDVERADRQVDGTEEDEPHHAAGARRDVVLTSPLVRARQTAEIVAAGLTPRPSLVTVDSLAPDGSFAAVIADLEKYARKARIALVGHEPNIGELAARLIGSRHAVEFKKGAVCRVDLEALPPSGPGQLRWLLTPKIMRALKK